MQQKDYRKKCMTLLPYRDLNALQTVGYRELFEHFEHHIALDRAVELIKQNTSNYAKRQVTWFRKEGFSWIDAIKSPAALRESISPMIAE